LPGTERRTAHRLKRVWSSLTRGEWGFPRQHGPLIRLLHAIGFGTLLEAATPHRLTFGVGVLAYSLGLRHAFDADHVAAVDNMTRKTPRRQRRASRWR
jgi:high-affinity nickel-transport protein